MRVLNRCARRLATLGPSDIRTIHNFQQSGEWLRSNQRKQLHVSEEARTDRSVPDEGR